MYMLDFGSSKPDPNINIYRYFGLPGTVDDTAHWPASLIEDKTSALEWELFYLTYKKAKRLGYFLDVDSIFTTLDLFQLYRENVKVKEWPFFKPHFPDPPKGEVNLGDAAHLWMTLLLLMLNKYCTAGKTRGYDHVAMLRPVGEWPASETGLSLESKRDLLRAQVAELRKFRVLFQTDLNASVLNVASLSFCEINGDMVYDSHSYVAHAQYERVVGRLNRLKEGDAVFLKYDLVIMARRSPQGTQVLPKDFAGNFKEQVRAHVNALTEWAPGGVGSSKIDFEFKLRSVRIFEEESSIAVSEESPLPVEISSVENASARTAAALGMASVLDHICISGRYTPRWLERTTEKSLYVHDIYARAAVLSLLKDNALQVLAEPDATRFPDVLSGSVPWGTFPPQNHLALKWFGASDDSAETRGALTQRIMTPSQKRELYLIPAHGVYLDKSEPPENFWGRVDASSTTPLKNLLVYEALGAYKLYLEYANLVGQKAEERVAIESYFKLASDSWELFRNPPFKKLEAKS